MKSNYTFVVHDSLKELHNLYLKVEYINDKFSKTSSKIYKDHQVKFDKRGNTRYLNKKSMNHVSKALDTLNAWRKNYPIIDSQIQNEFEDKVLSGKYPWYILKVKQNLTTNQTVTFELDYELELGESVKDRKKNYFHFMFTSKEKTLKIPVHLRIHLKNLPFRKIKSKLPDGISYSKETKSIIGSIDPFEPDFSKNLVIFFR